MNLICMFLHLISAEIIPDFYHSTSEILESLKALPCPGLKLIENDYIHAFSLGSDSNNRAFLLFGEHPRELITVELAFFLLKEICKEIPEGLAQLVVVVNALPESRKRVEAGEYCLRTNGNGVNINRNWDVSWKKADCDADINQNCPGSSPFSEKETQAIKDLLEEFNPDVFLTVHSGVDSMMYPYASSLEQIDDALKTRLDQVLGEINQDFSLQSAVGEASAVLSSITDGTCLDYAYEVLGIRNSLCFEIYQEKQPRLFLQLNAGKSPSLNDPDSCLAFFNPLDPTTFQSTLSEWKHAILKLLSSLL